MSSYPPARRRTVRALSGIAAAVAALLVWLVAVPIAGVELAFTDMNDVAREVTPPAVVLFSVGSGLAGWAFAAVLERLVPRWATTVWTVVAVAVLALSMVPVLPLEPAAAVVLALMHLVVGAVVIAAVRVTAPPRPQAVPALA